MNKQKNETVARAMYDSYCRAVGGVAFNGDPLPKSEEFFTDPTKKKQADGWRVAAETAHGMIKNNNTGNRANRPGAEL